MEGAGEPRGSSFLPGTRPGCLTSGLASAGKRQLFFLMGQQGCRCLAIPAVS